MEMPLALFEEVTGLSGVRTGERAKGKRAAGRVPVARNAMVCRIYLGEATEPVPAVVREMSTNGIGLVCTRKMPVGEQFVAHLPRRGAATIPVRYVVIRCEKGPAGQDGRETYAVGASFAAVMDPAFLPPKPAAAAPDATKERERINRAILDS